MLEDPGGGIVPGLRCCEPIGRAVAAGSVIAMSGARSRAKRQRRRCTADSAINPPALF